MLNRTMTHPITPPFELVAQWTEKAEDCEGAYEIDIATQAAQWGADQELEACCEWFTCDWTDIETADKLRTARRPKPPSLKEQALALLEVEHGLNVEDLDLLRRALEALPND